MKLYRRGNDNYYYNAIYFVNYNVLTYILILFIYKKDSIKKGMGEAGVELVKAN